MIIIKLQNIFNFLLPLKFPIFNRAVIIKLINVKTIKVGNIISNGLATVMLGKLNKKITNISTMKLTKETLLIFLNLIIKNIPIIIEITHEKKVIV